MIESIIDDAISGVKAYLKEHTPWDKLYRLWRLTYGHESMPVEEKFSFGDFKWDIIDYEVPGNLLCRELYHDDAFIKSVVEKRNSISKLALSSDEIKYFTYFFNRRIEMEVNSYITYYAKKLEEYVPYDPEVGKPWNISETKIKESFTEWYKEFLKPRIIKYELRINSEYHKSLMFPSIPKEEFSDGLQENCHFNGDFLTWDGHTATRNALLDEKKFISRYNLNQVLIQWLERTETPSTEEAFLRKRIAHFQQLINQLNEARGKGTISNAFAEESLAGYSYQIDVIQERLDEVINSNQGEAGTNLPNEGKFGIIENVPVPSNLKELFKSPKLLEECLQLLRETDPPTINEQNIFIGKNKGVIVVWLQTLERKGLFDPTYHITNDILRAALLNNYIKNLDISESLFRTPNKRANDNYKAHFAADISALKHSQD